jgi:hypothetical protein
LGEAFALAREVVQVEFDVDLSPLRAVGDPPTSGRRFLPRLGRRHTPTAQPFAERPYVVGEFSYGSGVRGHVMVIEANLTDQMPWDVQTWAEAQSKFPDDSTWDQLFDHRQFESYRALGHYQMSAGLVSADWQARHPTWRRGAGPRPRTAPPTTAKVPAPAP